jgi:hypothetical protein
MRIRLTIGLAFALIGIFYCHRNTSAATLAQQTPPGITLSPAVVQASIGSTESEHQLNFQITNNKPNRQTIDISTADFNTLGESGGLVFIGTNPTQLQKNTAWLLGLPCSKLLLPLSLNNQQP